MNDPVTDPVNAVRVAVDASGWVGAVVLVLGYALVSTGRLGGQSPAFVVLNLAGAGGLLVNGAYHGAWPSVALNVAWSVIGLAALARHRAADRTAGRQALGQSTDSDARDCCRVPHETTGVRP